MKSLSKLLLILIASFCFVFLSACGETPCLHNYAETTTKEATCKEFGIKTCTCIDCGQSYTEDIPKLTTHSYTSETTKEPTCAEVGITTYTCEVCGDCYTEDIEKKSHSFTRNNACVKCGQGTPELNMTTNEKELAEKVGYMRSYNYLIYKQEHCEIKFNMSISEYGTAFKDSTMIAVPTLVDIVVVDTFGDIIYSKIATVSSSDYFSDSANYNKLCGVAKIPYNELPHETADVDKVYYRIYNPSYISFSEKEVDFVQYNYLTDEYFHLKTCRLCAESYGKQAHEYGTDNKCVDCGHKLEYYGLNFSVSNDGKSYIVSSGNHTNIVIPKYHNGLPVSAIAIGAFEDSYVKTVRILAEIKEIPANAFRDCTYLEDIVMPDTITSIGTSAFSGCTKMIWSNELPKKLENIGMWAFEENGIGSLVIPKTVTKIGEFAFLNAWGFNRSIKFEDTNGWIVNGNVVKLTNGDSSNYTLLTSTYVTYEWTKSV